MTTNPSDKPDSTRPHLPDLYGRCSHCGVATECAGEDRPGREFGVVAKAAASPEKLPEVLPVGTRTLGNMLFRTEATLIPGTKHPVYRSADESQYAVSEHIDWAHWRATHSPPPSREGEALPTFRNHRDMGHPLNQTAYLMWTDGDRLQGRADDRDLAACLRAMPEERRATVLSPFGYAPNVTAAAREGLAELKQRAESAESRLVELEERHDVERETWYATNVRHAGELEAARARVGELESAARLECVISLGQAARFLQSFAEAVGQPCADAERWDFDASARHMMMCLGVRAHVVPHATDPTPTPTTPTSTFAAVADALPTNAEDERIPEDAEDLRQLESFQRWEASVHPQDHTTRSAFRAGIRFAHSEGAAEAGKRVADRVRRMRSAVSALLEYALFEDPHRLAKQLRSDIEALAAELEGVK